MTWGTVLVMLAGLAGCGGRSPVEPLRLNLHQQWQLQPGVTIGNAQVTSGLGDLMLALDRGYVDWLGEARQLAFGEAEGILFARTWSYWDPDLDDWNAPGLGNRWLSISEDQRRWQEAIEGVLSAASMQLNRSKTETVVLADLLKVSLGKSYSSNRTLVETMGFKVGAV